jgi:hypothetical protein
LEGELRELVKDERDELKLLLIVKTLEDVDVLILDRYYDDLEYVHLLQEATGILRQLAEETPNTSQ